MRVLIELYKGQVMRAYTDTPLTVYVRQWDDPKAITTARPAPRVSPTPIVTKILEPETMAFLLLEHTKDSPVFQEDFIREAAAKDGDH